MSLFVVALFYVLTPGILVSLPPKGNKMVVALTHAIVFAIVYSIVHKMVAKACKKMYLNMGMEGFEEEDGFQPNFKNKVPISRIFANGSKVFSAV